MARELAELSNDWYALGISDRERELAAMLIQTLRIPRPKDLRTLDRFELVLSAVMLLASRVADIELSVHAAEQNERKAES